MVGTSGVTVIANAAEGADAGPVATALVAAAVNVYVPAARPEIEQLVDADWQVAPPGLAVTFVDTIALPPLDDGAVQLIAAVPLADWLAVTAIGAPGADGPGSLIGADAADGNEVPAALEAVTVNDTVEPAASPDTTQLVAEVLHAALPPTRVAVYEVIALPPFDVGAFHETVADVPLAATALALVGAPGATGAGMNTQPVPAESGPVPAELVAATLNPSQRLPGDIAKLHDVAAVAQVTALTSPVA